MTMHRLMLVALLLLMPAVGFAAKAKILVTGDSYTRQSPGCTADYITCDIAGQILHERSYSTYLNAISRYQVATLDSSGRGGDTCTTQAAYTDGPWDGDARGILAQVDTRINNRDVDVVSILVGINDANLYGVSQATLQQCLEDLFVLVTGKKIVAMTYPPISSSTAVWGAGNGSVAAANRLWVNQAIRDAVTANNTNYPTHIVRLVDLASIWTTGASDIANYTADGAHPSTTGALKMTRKWFQEVCGGSTFIIGCTY